VDPAEKFDAHIANSSQLFVICGLQGTSEGRKSNEKYKASFKSGGVLQRPSCSGHQQNAEIAGKIAIMRESFCLSRQISKG
jgi:CO dehydrogenase/acetyl-CoA synthase alpha subunit